MNFNDINIISKSIFYVLYYVCVCVYYVFVCECMLPREKGFFTLEKNHYRKIFLPKW